MSHKILIGAALVAVVVLGFAWFGIGTSSGQNQTAVVSTTATQTGTAVVSIATTSPTDTGTSGNTTGGTAPPAGTYTMAQVATHNSASSCWAAINGKVYNLTAWINQHPGGPQRILSICGIDGSSAFNGQHGDQARPANELTGFLLGPLVK